MAANNLKPGDRLGPYTIEAVVGQGASAVVYRANDPRFGGPVAIKMLASHLAGDVEAVERFSGEARALRAVNNEAVVSVYDIGQTDEFVPYMVLGLADRGTLEDRLALGRPAIASELRTLLSFFERSLGALHDRGLVHRDVKPSNVLLASASGAIELTTPASFGMLRADDRLLLGDLGLVKDTTAGRVVTRGAGTHGYAAPEQRAVVSHVSTRSDLFAASAVIAEATLGRIRESDESWEDVAAQISLLGRPVFADALRSGLAEDPDQRPADVGEWTTRLRSALAASDPEVPDRANMRTDGGIGPIQSGSSLRNRSTRIAAVLAGCAAVIVAFALWFSSPADDPERVATGPGPGATSEPTPTGAPSTGGGPPPSPTGPTPTTAPAGATGQGADSPTTTPTPSASPTPPDPASGDEVLSDGVLPNESDDDSTDAGDPTATASPTATTVIEPSASPTATATATDIRSNPAPAPTATPTATATATPTATATVAPTATPSPTPTVVTSIRDIDCATAGTTTDEGPASGITVIGTTASTATLSWAPRDFPMSIFVGQQYLDNIRPGADLYIAEGLEVGQDSILAIADHNTPVPELVGRASIVCATSNTAVAGPPLIGPSMATDLVVVPGSVTSTSATLQWTPAAGGGRYTMWTGVLVPGRRYPRLSDEGAGNSAEGSTSFEFTNLPPGSEIVLGMRTIIEPNQSNLAWVTVNTPP